MHKAYLEGRRHGNTLEGSNKLSHLDSIDITVRRVVECHLSHLLLSRTSYSFFLSRANINVHS